MLPQIITSIIPGEVAVQEYLVSQKPGDYAYSSYEPSITISNLNPYSIYKFGVEAVNSVGSRGSSDQLQIRTGEVKTFSYPSVQCNWI